ncbi:glycosyltransferase family 4 protein, partial [Escherichia coli]|nr:glycosyltransferase family 4 protein [Escherichia coli]
KLKNRLLFYFLKKIKLINIFLAEHLSLVEYYKSKGLPALFCPNGTSPAYYSCKLPVKSNIVPTIIFVGTCGDDRKNAKLAVEAVSKLKFDCRIFFLGGETELFNKWFKKWSIGKPHDVIQRYIFCGYVNDVSRIIHYYDEAHVFLMTSVHEGYPLSLAQAAWRGCYPILSEGSGGGDMNIAGCAAIFHNEESLIDILDKSLSNLSATIAKGKKSRLYALNNNDWRLIIRKIEELI